MSDEIIRMAREAGMDIGMTATIMCNETSLERFAALVAAHTLENDTDLTIAYMKGGEDTKRRMEKRMQQLESQLQLCKTAVADELEACAKVVESGVLGHGECAAAIRAIKFEGDTGFRPVSEMIPEHKQDPKKAAAIEKAKMRKAEQEPVAVVEITYGREPECYVTGNIDDFPEGVFKLYAQPIRTKDLTDDEIEAICANLPFDENFDITVARAVIAADREKNK